MCLGLERDRSILGWPFREETFLGEAGWWHCRDRLAFGSPHFMVGTGHQGGGAGLRAPQGEAGR